MNRGLLCRALTIDVNQSQRERGVVHHMKCIQTPQLCTIPARWSYTLYHIWHWPNDRQAYRWKLSVVTIKTIHNSANSTGNLLDDVLERPGYGAVPLVAVYCLSNKRIFHTYGGGVVMAVSRWWALYRPCSYFHTLKHTAVTSLNS